MSTYLITGTSRGIGLELVKQLNELPTGLVAKIFAVTRSSSEPLQQIIDGSGGRVANILIEDITQEESVQKGVSEVERALGPSGGLDVLVNNAGKSAVSPDGMRSVPGDQLRDIFNVNVVSAQVVTMAFLPLLQKGKEKKIVNISSTLGSIGCVRNYSFAPTQAYKISKAALNMLTAQYALNLEKEGFTCFAISPGWLKTDLGSQRAELDVATGVSSVKDWLLKSDQTLNGKFVNIKAPGWETNGVDHYDGGEIPW